MSTPTIARPKPYLIRVEKDQRYFWCSCGRSETQPFCDGSHKGTNFTPVRYVACADEDILFCGCKHTKSSPLCDGAHNNLLDEYPSDDPDSAENRAIVRVDRVDGARTLLDNGCFVVNPATLDGHKEGNLQIVEFISSSNGARFQSQYFVSVEQGVSPAVSFGDSHVIGFIASGKGELTIAGRLFAVEAHNGFVVHSNEDFRFNNGDTDPLQLYLNVCPITAGPDFSAVMKDNFMAEFSERIAVVDRASAQTMADRFFQVLIDKRQGCTTATSFIGEIPFSKAEPHRHLYEESIVVLGGAGTMWTEKTKTDVAAGDVIFLPQKQRHSLQCTDKNGMYVLGVIYPGDNPSINY